MNRLPVPKTQDRAALKALVENDKLKSYPKLQPHLATLRNGYAQYLQVRGDAKALSLINLPAEISDLLRGHYASPPQDVGFIKKLRDKSGVMTCPMCGSFACGTLDHVVPKADQAAFAVLGLNLVPACRCNTKRSTTYVGPGAGERVLHPYFDKVLARRLIVARIENPGPVPRISLHILLPDTHCRYPAIRFHLENVVGRTQVLDHLRRRWAKLMRRPGTLIVPLKRNPKTLLELDQILLDERDRLDDLHDSRNNWDSIFLNGLLENSVQAWLFNALSRPGRMPNGPLL
ncbi:hypothetical protein D3C72_780080 [compost metagenome]